MKAAGFSYNYRKGFSASLFSLCFYIRTKIKKQLPILIGHIGEHAEDFFFLLILALHDSVDFSVPVIGAFHLAGAGKQPGFVDPKTGAYEGNGLIGRIILPVFYFCYSGNADVDDIAELGFGKLAAFAHHFNAFSNRQDEHLRINNNAVSELSQIIY